MRIRRCWFRSCSVWYFVPEEDDWDSTATLIETCPQKCIGGVMGRLVLHGGSNEDDEKNRTSLHHEEKSSIFNTKLFFTNLFIINFWCKVTDFLPKRLFVTFQLFSNRFIFAFLAEKWQSWTGGCIKKKSLCNISANLVVNYFVTLHKLLFPKRNM